MQKRYVVEGRHFDSIDWAREFAGRMAADHGVGIAIYGRNDWLAGLGSKRDRKPLEVVNPEPYRYDSEDLT